MIENNKNEIINKIQTKLVPIKTQPYYKDGLDFPMAVDNVFI